MSSTQITEKKLHDAPARSLGQILYAKPVPRVSEADWTALVAAIGSGSEQALRQLFHRAHSIVFTLALRIVNSRETAEELTVDVFHEVWRRAPQFEAADGSVVGWLMSLARSRAIDRLRHDQRKKRVDPCPVEPNAEAVQAGVSEVIDFRQQGARVRRALIVLTIEERRVIEAAFLGECTYAQVAGQLSLPLGTVKTRIRSALTKLRRVLAEEGPLR